MFFSLFYLCAFIFIEKKKFMETSAVIQLYEKSVEKHSLFYDPFIGDGDSLAYRELSKLMYMASKMN